MKTFIIGKNESGQRLDKFLHKYLKEASLSFLYKMLRKKNITLNQKKAVGKELLAEGDCIQFFFSEETFLKFKGETNLSLSGKINRSKIKESGYEWAYKKLRGISIIYEDEDVILLNKPAGILTQKAGREDLSINEWLIGYLLSEKKISTQQLETFRPSICNRLDRNTSGIVICGRSLRGSQKMNQLLRERSIHKFYRTFVKGKIEHPANIKGYLKKDISGNKVSFCERMETPDKSWEEVETRYFPLAFFEGITYLEVELITGKPHQIRAHLAFLGHPIVGDPKYGDRKLNKIFLQKGLPGWQLLHAYRLEVPADTVSFLSIWGKTFIAPEPAYFEKLKEGI